MKDILQDLIQYTSLGNIELIKIVGTDTETNVSAMPDDKSVIINGKFANPCADFIGTFGMPNLGKLKTILGFDDVYDEHSNITVTRKDRDGVSTPDTIHFATKTGDFVNDYRLMAKSIVEEKVKTVLFRGANWNVEFEPSVNGITRLKKQQSANSEEPTFTTKVENGELKIYFGDVSSHSGNFVFQSGITGSLTNAMKWPVAPVVAILSLPGDKKMRISDAGVMEITVNSGLGLYSYLLPQLTK
jgi:hypothetical protein